MKKEKNRIECSVCGHKFPIEKKSVYQVQDQPSFSDLLTGKTPVIFNAIDCPECGCQMVLKGRIPAVVAQPEAEAETDTDAEQPEWKSAMLRTFNGGEC